MSVTDLGVTDLGVKDPGQARRGYALCSVGRSGSSWFAEVVRSTGALGHPREFFNTRYQRRLYGPDYPQGRAAQVRLALTEGASPNGIYGLKVFPIHLEQAIRQIDWTEDLPDLHFVHWRRRDILGQAMSRHRALQTAQWRSTLDAEVVPEYDGPAIRTAMEWVLAQDARWELFFARNGIAPLRLIYEDAMAAVQPTVDSLSAFLGLDSRPTIDLGDVALDVQRDATTDEWRARFLAEFRGLNEMDAF